MNKVLIAENPNRPQADVVEGTCRHCPNPIKVKLEWWKDMSDWNFNFETHEPINWVQDEFEKAIYGNDGLCKKCLDRMCAGQAKAREYESDCAPADFDPTYAGETW